MPRTEVYQLRLTKAEKESLAREARERGISIARLIRGCVGFAEFPEPDGIAESLGGRGVKETLREADGGAINVSVEVGTSDPLTQRVRQLVASGTSRQRAERQARRELDL